jgi:hypothetical protein
MLNTTTCPRSKFHAANGSSIKKAGAPTYYIQINTNIDWCAVDNGAKAAVYAAFKRNGDDAKTSPKKHRLWGR